MSDLSTLKNLHELKIKQLKGEITNEDILSFVEAYPQLQAKNTISIGFETATVTTASAVLWSQISFKTDTHEFSDASWNIGLGGSVTIGKLTQFVDTNEFYNNAKFYVYRSLVGVAGTVHVTFLNENNIPLGEFIGVSAGVHAAVLIGKCHWNKI